MVIKFLVLLLLIFIGSATRKFIDSLLWNAIEEQSFKQIAGSTNEYNEEASQDSMYGSTLSVLKLLKSIDVSAFLNNLEDGIKTQASCKICNGFMSIFLMKKVSVEMFAFVAKTVCVTLQLSPRDVCFQMINSYEDVLRYVKSNSELKPYEMCGIFIGDMCITSGKNLQKTKTETDSKIYWTIPVSKPRSPFVHPDFAFWFKDTSENDLLQDVLSLKQEIETQSNVKKFVHITDAHIDLEYTPGNNAVCSEPMCCSRSNGPAALNSMSAGLMGDYRFCDARLILLRAALDTIEKNDFDANFVLWTGDNIPHAGYSLKREDIKTYLYVTTKIFRDFHDRTGIPVIPLLGNHDILPVNQLSYENVTDSATSSLWLFHYAASLWSRFTHGLKEENESWQAWDSFRANLGNYKIRISDKIVVVAINTVFCMRMNLFNLANPVDPGKVLLWLEQQLSETEGNNDKVFLVMHVPPDTRECMQSWLQNYLRIIDRYQDTILLQVSGHTHYDDFRVYLSQGEYSSKGTPIGINFATPALTSYSGTNPSYRLYHYDEKIGKVLNFETFSVNLTQANEMHRYNFELTYDAMSFYRINSLSAKELNKIVSKLHSDKNFYKEFVKKIYLTGSGYETDRHLEGVVKEQLLTSLRVGNPFDFTASHLFIKTIYSQGLNRL